VMNGLRVFMHNGMVYNFKHNACDNIKHMLRNIKKAYYLRTVLVNNS
jgi:predicted glutamine amidotransferase